MTDWDGLTHTQHSGAAPFDGHSASFGHDGSNDQAILAKWSKQRDNEDGDEWRWRLSDPHDDICEAFERVADAADAAAAARMGERGGGESIVVIDGIEGGGRRDGRLVNPVTGAVDC